jgi:lipopolysaccharide export system permease protein
MIPPVGLLTLPMALLLGTLLAYGRLAEENEITAMEVGGLTLAQVYRPAILFGGLVTLFLLFWSHFVVPKSLALTEQTVVSILRKTATSGVMPGRFVDLSSLTLVCERMHPGTKELFGTTIFENSRDGVAAVVTAPTAVLQLFPERGELVMDLRDVYLHRPRPVEGKKELRDQFLWAARMHWTTDVQQMVRRLVQKALRGGSKLGPLALNNEIKKEKNKNLRIELCIDRAFRLSLPFAAVLMAAVAAPLGVLMRRGQRAAAFAVTIVLVLVYYILLSLGKALAADAVIPPSLGVWLPNFAAAFIAAAAYRKTVYP